jgi:hypothetical protein
MGSQFVMQMSLAIDYKKISERQRKMTGNDGLLLKKNLFHISFSYKIAEWILWFSNSDNLMESTVRPLAEKPRIE